MATAFNGTTVTLNSKAFAKLQDVKKSVDVAEIAVHGASDTEAIYERGIPAKGWDITCLGPQTVADNEEGALSISWNDGTTDTLAAATVFAVTINGTINGAISKTYKIRKTE